MFGRLHKHSFLWLCVHGEVNVCAKYLMKGVQPQVSRNILTCKAQEPRVVWAETDDVIYMLVPPCCVQCELPLGTCACVTQQTGQPGCFMALLSLQQLPQQVSCLGE